MQTEHIVRYRWRDITAADVEFIPWLDCGASDRASPVLSKILCTAWNWKQENGVLREHADRSAARRAAPSRPGHRLRCGGHRPPARGSCWPSQRTEPRHQDDGIVTFYGPQLLRIQLGARQ